MHNHCHKRANNPFVDLELKKQEIVDVMQSVKAEIIKELGIFDEETVGELSEIPAAFTELEEMVNTKVSSIERRLNILLGNAGNNSMSADEKIKALHEFILSKYGSTEKAFEKLEESVNSIAIPKFSYNEQMEELTFGLQNKEG